MVHFAFLDYFWTIAYLVLMIGCGVIFYKLGKRSESDFSLPGADSLGGFPPLLITLPTPLPTLLCGFPAGCTAAACGECGTLYLPAGAP